MNGISLENTNKNDQFKLVIRGQIIMLDRDEIEGLKQIVNAFGGINFGNTLENRPFFERNNATMKSEG